MWLIWPVANSQVNQPKKLTCEKGGQSVEQVMQQKHIFLKITLDSVVKYRVILPYMETNTETLTIGKVATEASVGIETIRFYEREGLIDDPPRRASGYRNYPRDTILRLRFIKRAKELGFSLKEIKELLTLKLATGTTCNQMKAQADQKIDDIKSKIRTLQRMKRELKKLSSACGGKGSISECPILDALEQEQ